MTQDAGLPSAIAPGLLMGGIREAPWSAQALAATPAATGAIVSLGRAGGRRALADTEYEEVPHNSQ